MSVLGLVDVAGGMNLGAGTQGFMAVDGYTTANSPNGACDPCCPDRKCCGDGGGNGCGNGGGGGCSANDTTGISATWGSTGGTHPFLPVTTPGLIATQVRSCADCCAQSPAGAGPAASGTVIPVVPLPGIAIPSVPGSSAPYSQSVSVIKLHYGNVAGLLVTCTDTGVTLTSLCSNAVFYHNSTGTKQYTTPGGNCTLCVFGTPLSATSGSASGAVPNTVTIDVS